MDMSFEQLQLSLQPLAQLGLVVVTLTCRSAPSLFKSSHGEKDEIQWKPVEEWRHACVSPDLLRHVFEAVDSRQAQVVHRITDHRMMGVGRDLWRSSITTPMLTQGHPEQGAQDIIQVGLGSLQRSRLHNPSGSLCQERSHPHRKEIPPHVQLEPLVFQFVPVD